MKCHIKKCIVVFCICTIIFVPVISMAGWHCQFIWVPEGQQRPTGTPPDEPGCWQRCEDDEGNVNWFYYKEVRTLNECMSYN